ncbi:MAG: dihydrodipicolinate synthase family protein [Bacteroidales bacterium]|nr:dihydrodipicolinate synthase family protein [Bacteroidales bacterium]
MDSLSFKGIFPPLPTSFDRDENLLPEKIRFNIKKLSRHKLAGFLILGSNGEQVMLSEREKLAAIAAARDALPEGRLLLAGTGCQSTRETISLTRAAAAEGAHAVLVINPSFYKGNMNQEELVRHYFDVADGSPVPVLVYNMPANTGVDMTARMIIAMAEHPNIVGLKESGGNVVKMGEVLGNVKTGFQVLAGGAGFLLPSLAMGVAGGILACANIAPDHCLGIYDAFVAGDIPRARNLQHTIIPLNAAVTARWGVPALKAAMDHLGLYGGHVRRPLLPLREEIRKQLVDMMGETGLKLYTDNN